MPIPQNVQQVGLKVCFSWQISNDYHTCTLLLPNSAGSEVWSHFKLWWAISGYIRQPSFGNEEKYKRNQKDTKNTSWCNAFDLRHTMCIIQSRVRKASIFFHTKKCRLVPKCIHCYYTILYLMPYAFCKHCVFSEASTDTRREARGGRIQLASLLPQFAIENHDFYHLVN